MMTTDKTLMEGTSSIPSMGCGEPGPAGTTPEGEGRIVFRPFYPELPQAVLEAQRAGSADKRTVTFDYMPLDLVRIKELDTKGRVLSALIGRQCKEYNVEYWWNGEHRHDWMLADEIEPRGA